MQVLQEIKFTRLFLAVGVTLLVADTVPHPGLAPGLLESSLSRIQKELVGEDENRSYTVADTDF